MKLRGIFNQHKAKESEIKKLFSGFEYIVIDEDGVKHIVHDSYSLSRGGINEEIYQKTFTHAVNTKQINGYVRYKYD